MSPTKSGRFSLTGLTPGVTVSVKQISTTDGWLMDGSPKTITIRSGNAQSLTFFNDPEQTLTVRLYVKDTTTPIPGAKFLLRDSGGSLVGTNNGEFTTDRNGEFTITGLVPGVTITGTQTATVSGYVLDSAPQSILIRSGEAQTLTWYNPVKGMLTVRKLDAATDEPLQGAEFRITTVQGVPVDDHEGRTSSNSLYTTDARGEIVIEMFLPGTYTVTETRAPSGYTLDRTPQTVVVNENDSQTLTFRDTALQSLTIVKYEEGTTTPLAGVTFSVTDGNGVPVGNGTYTTDANGRITINGLTPGMTVVVRETRTVRGYNGTWDSDQGAKKEREHGMMKVR